MNNIVEYACGLDPHRVSKPPRLVPSIIEINGEQRFSIETTMAYGPKDAIMGWQALGTGGAWESIISIEKAQVSPNPDGSAKVRFVENAPLEDQPLRFLRLRIW